MVEVLGDNGGEWQERPCCSGRVDHKESGVTTRYALVVGHRLVVAAIRCRREPHWQLQGVRAATLAVRNVGGGRRLVAAAHDGLAREPKGVLLAEAAIQRTQLNRVLWQPRVEVEEGGGGARVRRHPPARLGLLQRVAADGKDWLAQLKEQEGGGDGQRPRAARGAHAARPTPPMSAATRV